MNRLRSLRFHCLPLLLAALTLRALIPADVASSSQGLTFTASMCSYDRGKTEVIEIPGDEQNDAPHCEYCVAPLLGAPLATPRFELPAAALVAGIPRAEPVRLGSELPRAQSARGPPTYS